MNNETSRNLRLGIFIIAGTLLFIASMYYIGDKQNMFGSNFRLKAVFKNINGLQPGNNVRYMGIDIGTVKAITVLTDTSVEVTMTITEDIQAFIKKDAVASIGTDGLMGNKLINISPGSQSASPVEDGYLLSSRNILDTDNILEKLEQTNSNLLLITSGLVESIRKANNQKSVIGRLLGDTVMADDFQETLANLRIISVHSRDITLDLKRKLNAISREEGSALELLSDTTVGKDIRQTIAGIKAAGANAQIIAEELEKLVAGLNQGEGTLGVLLKDQETASNIEKSIENVQKGTRSFNESMDALKQSFLFRRYFRRLEREREADTP